jgi:drug/metabolite transporter (DMT)-like permease
MSAMRTETATPLRLFIAFAAVYVIWGSTYLAIRYAVEDIPPFLMGGSRFFAAGAMLWIVLKLWNATGASWRQWRSAAIIGTLLLAGGNGGVSWAEQKIPSGVAALLVAGVPMWMVLLNWIWGQKHRPSLRTVSGLVVGFVGLTVLMAPWTWRYDADLHVPGLFALLAATVSWAVGSIYSKTADLPRSPLLATAMEMAAGGAVMMAIGLLRGELSGWSWQSVQAPALWSYLYLVFVGSLGGFSAYIYLLKHTSPARASTYAFVNPMVAVLLGWLIADEALTGRIVAAGGLIILGVIVILLPKQTDRPLESVTAD